jgi:hypothetical protein
MNTTSMARPDRSDLPLLPSDLAKPEQTLIRAAVGNFLSFVDEGRGNTAAETFIRKLWPRDAATRAS